MAIADGRRYRLHTQLSRNQSLILWSYPRVFLLVKYVYHNPHFVAEHAFALIYVSRNGFNKDIYNDFFVLILQVAYVCRHPLLSKSQLVRNFITLTEHKAWKMSKRQGEKDQLAAGNFFLTVAIPPSVTPITDREGPLDHFKKSARGTVKLYTT